MGARRHLLVGALTGAMTAGGCCHPSVTAVPMSPWNQHDKHHGIPFYLPKPLLVVSKNVRYVEEAKVGLTTSAPIPGVFDDQSKYADVNSRSQFDGTGGGGGGTSTVTNNLNAMPGGPAPVLHGTGDIPLSPKEAPKDGLTPDVFYTYQIVFVPDLSQKYGLKVKGGAGEIRAAMNLVNGWMFTGLGPYYMKDSSTAQNILAGGISSRLALGGVGDVIKSVTDLRKAAVTNPQRSGEVTDGEFAKYVDRISSIQKTYEADRYVCSVPNYAEIYVYEPVLHPDGTSEWRQILNHTFDRPIVSHGGTTNIFMKDGKAADAPRSAPLTPGTHGAPAEKKTDEKKEIPPGEPRAGELIFPADDDVTRALIERGTGLPAGTLNRGANQPRAGGLGVAPGPGGVSVVVNSPTTHGHAGGVGLLQRAWNKVCHRPVNKTSVVAGSELYGTLPEPGVVVSPTTREVVKDLKEALTIEPVEGRR